MCWPYHPRLPRVCLMLTDSRLASRLARLPEGRRALSAGSLRVVASPLRRPSVQLVEKLAPSAVMSAWSNAQSDVSRRTNEPRLRPRQRRQLRSGVRGQILQIYLPKIHTKGSTTPFGLMSNGGLIMPSSSALGILPMEETKK